MVKFWHKSLKILLSLVTMSLILISCTHTDIQSERTDRTLFLMDTVISLQVHSQNPEEVCDTIAAALSDFEARASAHLETSEIALVNRQAGIAPVSVSGDIYEIVARSLEAFKLSDGLFDITIGSLTKLWGIGTEQETVPSDQEIMAAQELVDSSNIILDASAKTVFLTTEGMRIDLGGIAKGYALDIIRKILSDAQAKQAVVSIGGNVFVYKDKDGQPFTVGIRYPTNASTSYLCALRLKDTVVSTSGAYERYFVRDGVIYHHIIDPRTGKPAQSDLQSVSIIGLNGMDDDFLSTALYIGGLAYATERMKANEILAVLIDQDNRVYLNASLREQLIPELSDTDRYTFIFV